MRRGWWIKSGPTFLAALKTQFDSFPHLLILVFSCPFTCMCKAYPNSMAICFLHLEEKGLFWPFHRIPFCRPLRSGSPGFPFGINESCFIPLSEMTIKNVMINFVSLSDSLPYCLIFLCPRGRQSLQWSLCCVLGSCESGQLSRHSPLGHKLLPTPSAVGATLPLGIVWNVWTNYETLHFLDSLNLGYINIV